MTISQNKRDFQRKLPLDKGLKEAVADYLRRELPGARAKTTARRFNLTLDQARSAVAGKASLATIERIFKTGGWRVVFVIVADVIGQNIWNYLIELRKTHEHHGEQLRALGGDWWPLAADRSFDPSDGDLPLPDRERAVRRRMG